MVDGNPWLKGREVALMLQYQNTQKAIRDHIDEEGKRNIEDLLKTRCVAMGGVAETPLDWNEKNTIYVNEFGLYSLILCSNKPEAKQIKRWIAFTVLPSL